MENFNVDRIFLTGDIHYRFSRFVRRLEPYSLTENDIVIILGDSCLGMTSFYADDKEKLDIYNKKIAPVRKHIKAKIVCIQGNHDLPFSQMNAPTINFFGAKAKLEHGIIYILNGEVFKINGTRFLVLGGASSNSKERRLAKGLPYFDNEEMSKTEMQKIFRRIRFKRYDYILSHTAPLSLIPERKYEFLDERTNTEFRTEHFLQTVKDCTKIYGWFCGHYHRNTNIPPLTVLFERVFELRRASKKEFKGTK